MPVLILSGEKDPVGSYGRGVVEVFNKLKENSLEDVSLKIYTGCRHELLHDVKKGEVMCDILKWLEKRV